MSKSPSPIMSKLSWLMLGLLLVGNAPAYDFFDEAGQDESIPYKGYGESSEEEQAPSSRQNDYGFFDEIGRGESIPYRGSGDSSEDTDDDYYPDRSPNRRFSNRSRTTSNQESSAKSGTYAPLTGPKKTIAVLPFENRVQSAFGSWGIGEGMTEMLVTELFRSGHFIIVERSMLDSVISEQSLGQTGLVREGMAARVGQMLGAQLLIKGVVSEFEHKQSGQGGGITYKGISLGGQSNKAHVGIDVRIIDASSGQIIEAHSVKTTASSSGMNIGYAASPDLKIGTGGFNKTPLGQATRQAIRKAVAFVISKSRNVPWSGAIVKVDGSKTYINRGANSNLQPGTTLVLFSKGEELIDPQTGISLGSEDELIGRVLVTEVKSKYSIGRLQMHAGAQAKRGDVVRME